MRSSRYILTIILLTAAASLRCGAQELLSHRVRFSPSKTMDADLPKSVDNSRLKYFPPVFSQSGGSCAQASGIGYLFTYEINRLLDRDASASDANRLSYEFAWHMVNDGEDQGGFVDEGLMLAKNYGIMTAADYGASGATVFKWASGFEKYRNAMRHRASQILVYDDSIPLMKRYLYDAGDGSEAGGILTFSATATGWEMDTAYDGPSETGYRCLLTTLAYDGSHAMTIVGYDDTVCYRDTSGVLHEGAFIVVNSWGSYMHDRGRFYLPYDFFRDPDVSTFQLSNTVSGVRVKMHEPKVLFKVKVDYSARNDLRYHVGLSSESRASQPERQHIVGAFKNQGGDHPMSGAYFGSEIEMAFDITELMDTSVDYGRFFLNINKSVAGKKRGEGALTALSIVDLRGEKMVEYNYRGPLPAPIEGGNNWFSIATRPSFKVPVSSYTFKEGYDEIKPGTYLIRTADGRKGKMRIFFRGDGRLDVQYQVVQ